MKIVKRLIFLLMILFAIRWCQLECRKAYVSGYFAGCNTEIASCGYKYKNDNWVWVGVGNEDYSPYTEIATDRKGSRYWWAEVKRISK